MADSTINDYLVDYYFPSHSGTPEAHHFSLDGIMDLHKQGATITRICSIKEKPYRPLDVTEKTLKFVRSK